MQVGIEGGVLAEIGEYQCEDNQRPKSIQFDFAPGLRRCFAVVDEEFLGLLGHHGKQGEEDHHEEDGAHQRQGAEESEVAHGFGLHEDETGKGRHRGEVADDQRLDDILQGLAFVGFLLDVVEIMQGVVDRDADDDRADAHHDERNARLEQGDDRQGEDPAKEDGDAQPKQVTLARHGKHQDAENQHKGDGEREETVSLDLPGIGNRYGGRADSRDAHPRMLALGQPYHLIDQIHYLGVALGVAAREWRREEGKAFVAAFVEEVFVFKAVVLCGIERVEALQGRRIEVERVGLDAIDDETGRRHGQHPLDVGHASGHMVGVGQQRVHASVVGFGEKQGLVLTDEVHGVKHFAAIDATLQVADDLCRVAFLPMALKGIHGIHDGIDGFIIGQ